MIRSVCMICGIQYGTKESELPGDTKSHGYCERHYDEAMSQLNSQYADLPADRAHVGCV